MPAATTVWLCGLLVAAPLPFGGVTFGASTWLAIGCFVALLLALTSADWPPRGAPAYRVALLVAAVGLFGLLQSLSLPEALVEALSPGHAMHVEATGELLGATDLPTRLSLAPGASRQAALGWLAAAAALLAAAVAGRQRRWRWALLAALVGTALLEAFFGAQRLFARATSIWGVEVAGSPDRLRGTFVNADHLALYLEMALVVVFAWIYRSWRRARRQAAVEWRVVQVATPLICWLALFTALTFTGSRAGLLAGLGATLAQGVLLAAALRSWRVAPAGVLAGAAAVAVVAWIGVEQGFGRLLGTSAYEAAWNARPQIYSSSVDLWRLFPLTGSGLGTFEEAFPLVQPADIAGRVWSHAHNGWLEMLVTTGVVGAVLLVAGLWCLLSGLRAVLMGARSSSSRAFALAALGAVLAVGLHETLDFGLTMPANAVTLAVIVGAALGAWRRYGEGPRSVRSPGTKARRSAAASSSRAGAGSMSKRTGSGSPG